MWSKPVDMPVLPSTTTTTTGPWSGPVRRQGGSYDTDRAFAQPVDGLPAVGEVF